MKIPLPKFVRRAIIDSLTTDEEIHAAIRGSSSDTAFHVSPTTALESPTFMACVRLLAETVSSLPLFVLRRHGEGKERDTKHPLHRVLHDLSNPWTSSHELRMAVSIDALTSTQGAGFARVIRSAGRVVELHRLRPDSVSVRIRDDGAPEYAFTDASGRQVVLGHHDVLHLRPFSTAPDQCVSLTKKLAEAVKAEVCLLRYIRRLASSGLRPSGILSSVNNLNPTALKNLRDAIEAQRGEDVLVLPTAAKFDQTSFTSVDAEFSSLLRFIVETIARGFGIPGPLIGDLSRATWSNSETMGRQFYTLSLRPLIAAWEGAIYRTLLTPAEQTTHIAEFLLDDIVSADIRQRYEAFFKAVNGPWLTANEVRSIDNRLPIEGGDVLRPPMNSAPAGEEPREEKEAA